MAIKKEILKNVKEANAEEKKITPKAIELVHDMANWVCETVMQLTVYIKQKAKEIETMEKWQQVKDKFVDMFQENQLLESEIKGLHQEIDNYNKADKEFTEVIESKKELIRDIEEYEKIKINN